MSELTKSAKSKATRSDGVRAVQRGELDGISNKYKGIDDLGEFKMLCSVLGTGKDEDQAPRDRRSLPPRQDLHGVANRQGLRLRSC